MPPIALTNEQIQFLADFANKGLAEQAEATARQQQVDADLAAKQTVAAKLPQVQAQVDTFVAQQLDGYQAVITPAEG